MCDHAHILRAPEGLLQNEVSMEQRAPSATVKNPGSSNLCCCGSSMPKSSYLCTGCWGSLNIVQQADLRSIRRAIRERRLHRLPSLGRG
jgi:hypothetical protein